MLKKLISLILLSALLLPGPTLAEALETQTLPALTETQSYVDLKDSRVRDVEGFMRWLSEHPALRRVDMYESRLKAEEIDALAERFPGIEFGWTIRLTEDHYVRTDATAYAINHNNRSALHKSEDFRQLKYCKNLMALDLGHNAIDDISFMKDLKQLRVIILANNFITDISPLSELKDLEYVELFNNYITDYSPLSGLDRLIDLNIAFNQTQDFTPLYGLKRLERLWVYNANNRSSSDPVDPNLVAALQQALPDTEINSTSYSTLGGWRKHPRYYVVFNMLHGAVAWLPWSAQGLVPRYN